MDLSPAIVSAIAAALAVPLFMAMMRRIKSFRHKPDSSRSFAELAREYQKWEYFGVIASFTLVAAITYGLGILLEALYSKRLDEFGMDRFVLSLPAVAWFIPALFLALFIASIPLHYLFLGLLGRRRYAEYTEYGNQKFKIDSWKLFRYLGYLLLPLCLVLTVLAFDTYARVTERSFVVNAFLGIGEKSYRFNQLVELELIESFEAPNGDIVRRPYYVVSFDDGEAYDFRKSPLELDLEQQRRLVLFLSDASGLPVVIRDPFPA